MQRIAGSDPAADGPGLAAPLWPRQDAACGDCWLWGPGGSDAFAYFTRVNVVVSQEIWPTQPDRSKAFLLVTVTAPK